MLNYNFEETINTLSQGLGIDVETTKRLVGEKSTITPDELADVVKSFGTAPLKPDTELNAFSTYVIYGSNGVSVVSEGEVFGSPDSVIAIQIVYTGNLKRVLKKMKNQRLSNADIETLAKWAHETHTSGQVQIFDRDYTYNEVLSELKEFDNALDMYNDYYRPLTGLVLGQ